MQNDIIYAIVWLYYKLLIVLQFNPYIFMKRIAFYAGSFDPFTVGHFRIVCEALCNYDKVIIAVGTNDSKKAMLTPSVRMEMIDRTISDFVSLYRNRKNICIEFADSELKALERLHKNRGCVAISSYDGLTVDAALHLGATALVRGTRINGADVEELELAETNKRLLAVRHRQLEMDIIHVPEGKDLQYISSSAYKKLCSAGEYVLASSYVSSGVHDYMMQYYLEKTFLTAFDDAFPQELRLNSQKIWHFLVNTYIGRDYHNLAHLAYGLNYFNIFCRLSNQAKVIDREIFILAWFFHDLCQGDDAEERSINAVKSLLNFDCTNISKLIRATIHAPETVRKTQAEKLIGDIDMAILGDSNNYSRYCNGICREYAHFYDYPEKRRAFLKQLLERKIFNLKFFSKMLEESARANIENEYEKLWYQISHED